MDCQSSIDQNKRHADEGFAIASANSDLVCPHRKHVQTASRGQPIESRGLDFFGYQQSQAVIERTV